MGKVLLAGLDEPRLRAALAATRFERMTPHTVTSATRLRAILRVVRERGWAVNDQELDLGLRSCSAPVLDRDGATVAALNVSVPSAQASLAELEQRYVPAVVEAAREITQVVRNRL
jgi:IclR family pca regulon transcriptional regulator